ncbi:MAG: M28 family peptidase [Paludibacteraceae bacterium]|nr:M28 family peptidase [Paludibacteraceae bacterium]
MKSNQLIKLIGLVGIVALTCSCGKSGKEQTVAHPDFVADSAFRYVAEQVHWGPRVPGSDAHTRCVVYLVQKLRSFGAEVTLQQGTRINYAGEQQPIYNVIGHFPGYSTAGAILLCAHYDSRPWCDEEEVYEERFQGVPGANDGASGVGVLLEVARQIGLKRDSTAETKAGQRAIDIVFFDCEDMGTPSFYTGTQRENTWCLGSQLWAEQFAYGEEQPVSEHYEYGILLDMVGAPDAVFPKEYYSMQGAGDYVEKIWKHATRLGYGNHFTTQTAYPIMDDHFYVSTIAGIPCVDIIHYDAKANSGFPYWWHTRQDNMRNIDKNTLRAVGETVLSCLNY